MYKILVDKQSFQCIAGCRVVGLCIQHNLHSLVQVCLLVQVHMTDTFGMTKYRNVLGLVFDVSDHLTGASRNDEINVLIHDKKVGDFLSTRHK